MNAARRQVPAGARAPAGVHKAPRLFIRLVTHQTFTEVPGWAGSPQIM